MRLLEKWHRKAAALLIIGVVFLLVVRSFKDDPTIGDLEVEDVIVAFGDSLTYGSGANPNESYPSVLLQMTGYKVINAGLSGEVSSRGLQRLPSILKTYRPRLVILCHGGNDILRQMNQGQLIKNIDKMITMIKQSGSDVVLVGVPKVGLFPVAASFYGDLAEKHDIPYESKVVARVLSDPALKSDRIHPNAEGYREMAVDIGSLVKASID